MAKDDPWMIVEAASSGWDQTFNAAGSPSPPTKLLIPAPIIHQAAPLAPRPILTTEELMDRWQVSRDAVHARIDDAANPLAFIPLAITKTTSRINLRFRLVAVEAWEAANEWRTISHDDPRYEPPGRPSYYHGPTFTGRKPKSHAKKPGNNG